ncbi:hypothetical protein BpHYR1_042513 [Brachionus plicatilis]|uniref:Uncharacterized protein n=1 Tax=Brachionus plicatilis TaxID=10195 RepID=A0A3M7SXQ8_BRAPC|nr:hypothetical protein BpHYR1_042513 [Brachionus plicatilis]
MKWYIFAEFDKPSVSTYEHIFGPYIPVKSTSLKSFSVIIDFEMFYKFRIGFILSILSNVNISPLK